MCESFHLEVLKNQDQEQILEMVFSRFFFACIFSNAIFVKSRSEWVAKRVGGLVSKMRGVAQAGGGGGGEGGGGGGEGEAGGGGGGKRLDLRRQAGASKFGSSLKPLSSFE